ncbi:hypothetical protein BASA83_001723 [Batrachochytrium salamandrivorans]|nr:hypothetical protein BASA83_001723 [Batrachochytrium salamandrivorans]
MKLSGVFVAAMVITSVNAGLLDDIMWGVGNIQTTLASVFSSSSTSNSGLDTVKQQKEDNPMIQHKLNNDLVHNGLLIKMFNIQKEILDLMTQVENESSEYRTTMELANLLAKTKLAEGFNSDNSNHQKVTKLVDQIDACLIELETLELKYLGEYHILPKDCPILGVSHLQVIVGKVKDSLKLPEYQPRSYQIQNPYNH